MITASEAPAIVEFGRFTVLAHRREVLKDGQPIELGGRAFDVLLTLIGANGTVVSKEELTSRVWPGRIVEEGNLRAQIKVLRKAFADRDLIRTVAGRGYLFAAEVRVRDLMEQDRSGSAPITAPHLSIVVLPFANLSDDRYQQYHADAITDDVTTDLSRLEGMFVISRSTAFTYRGKAINTKQIGRELGVRYVLEGSVRRSDDHIRVNAQLIDAMTDAHLWAEQFDREVGDLFALQDEITRRIAIELNVELVAVEVTRPTDHLDALDYILRGRAAAAAAPTREKFARAISFYERALALDPHSIVAQVRLAAQLVGRVLDDMTDAPTVDIKRAQELVDKVLPISPRNRIARYVRGQLLRYQHNYKDAMAEYETVLALNRNQVQTISHLAICKFLTGAEEEAIPLIERAIRLSPHDPALCMWYYRLGLINLYQSRPEEAVVWLERALGVNPRYVLAHWTMAAALGIAGDRDRAAAALAEARTLDTAELYATIDRIRANWVAARTDRRFETIFLIGLRRAGLPEE